MTRKEELLCYLGFEIFENNQSKSKSRGGARTNTA